MAANRGKQVRTYRESGMSWQDIKSETLLMMPEPFLDAYDLVWTLAFSDGSRQTREHAGDEQKARGTRIDLRLRSGQVTQIGYTSGGGGKRDGADPLKSERALEVKARVDRQLRKLARTMTLELGGDDEVKVVVRCSGKRCGRFLEEGWIVCPWCGSEARREIAHERI